MQKRLFYIASSLVVLRAVLFVPKVAQGANYVMDANLCQQVKTRLKQIKLHDAVTRVNYGQVYESISMHIMEPTNARLVNNQLKPVDLLIVSEDYEKQLVKFRQDYVLYEEKISQVVEISCQSDYQKLLVKLDELRQMRQQLRFDTIRLQELALQYWAKFKEFYEQQKAV